MDGDLEFGRDGRFQYRMVAAVVGDHALGCFSLIDPGPELPKLCCLGADHRRRLGLMFGDRVLVRSWLEVVPAVAAIDPSSYTEPAEPVAATSPRVLSAAEREVGRLFERGLIDAEAEMEKIAREFLGGRCAGEPAETVEPKRDGYKYGGML